MIDVSDGISSDLKHLCHESGVGARVDADLLPLDVNMSAFTEDNSDALALALHGGEDYELLFTVHPRKISKVPAELNGVPVTQIGEITKKSTGLKIRTGGKWTRLLAAGYQHF